MFNMFNMLFGAYQQVRQLRANVGRGGKVVADVFATGARECRQVGKHCTKVAGSGVVIYGVMVAVALCASIAAPFLCVIIQNITVKACVAVASAAAYALLACSFERLRTFHKDIGLPLQEGYFRQKIIYGSMIAASVFTMGSATVVCSMINNVAIIASSAILVATAVSVLAFACQGLMACKKVCSEKIHGLFGGSDEVGLQASDDGDRMSDRVAMDTQAGARGEKPLGRGVQEPIQEEPMPAVFSLFALRDAVLGCWDKWGLKASVDEDSMSSRVAMYPQAGARGEKPLGMLVQEPTVLSMADAQRCAG